MSAVVNIEYCLLGIDWWAFCMTKSEWSGWVQAVGALLALLATGALAWWETRQRRMDATHENAALLSARVHLVDHFHGALLSYLGSNSDAGVIAAFDERSKRHRQLKRAIRKVSEIDLAEMPTRSAVLYLRDVQGIASLVDEKLPLEGRVRLKAEVLYELGQWRERLASYRHELEAEAKRLAR